MKLATIINKIVEDWEKIQKVHAVARVVVQRYGHTTKFAKNIVALTLKQRYGLTDEQLADLMGTDAGKWLGYRHRPNPSTFSKVRKRSDPKILEETYNWLVEEILKGKQIRLIAQDSTDIPAYSQRDKDARYGHKTPSKKEQIARKEAKKGYVFGYKLHLMGDVEYEIPIAPKIAPANRHDKKFFHYLYDTIKSRFTLNHEAKFIADSAYDATDIYQELHYDGIKPVIATNGRGFYKSKKPKDPEYGKRWAIERIFSRLKKVFGMENNRFVGIKKVTIFVFSCLLAYLIRYVL